MSVIDKIGLNYTLYEALYLQIQDTLNFTKDFFDSCVSSLSIENLPKSFIGLPEFLFYFELDEEFHFNEFQLLLLKTSLLILLITWFLIYISWFVYGKRICERFMIPASSATIEQLKESVSKLKLPKEYSPRN